MAAVNAAFCQRCWMLTTARLCLVERAFAKIPTIFSFCLSACCDLSLGAHGGV